MHQILETLKFFEYINGNAGNRKEFLVLLGIYDREMQKMKVYK